MALYYIAGFGVNGSGLAMTCTVASFSATVGAGTYAHVPMTNVSSTSGYTEFAAALKSALDTAGGGPYTVSYSTITHTYTISRASTFTLAFTGSSGARLATAIGFDVAGVSGASSYTSTLRPYYVMVPTELARSGTLPFVYEPDGITEEAVSDGGTPYAVSKRTSELWQDWTQTMEARANVFVQFADAAVPWTWQDFFKHVRGTYPFLVSETGYNDIVYKLRADGTSFKPKPVVSDWDSLFNLKFSTRWIGDNS